MSTFDDPLEPQRALRPGCSCGRHVSQQDHDRAEQPQLQSAAVASEENRYAGVVASAVVRAMFRKDAARRAFLQSVGAATALELFS